ncbi:uncharacterized protein F4822DRAFT_305338 [Hypoxylon trugodes]|uniref:uncharacterized protein n=1 Tax=Hypoxylon trugodes TaxID=326681 RepID=UPI00219666BB|nr:uncharacterized protein F4822DRAFT_305338 [Hypoxylon trugodes]KAI1386096.1 hypothetical protein F4822DRAFT_305338 [Hypoxylon trugodes]
MPGHHHNHRHARRDGWEQFIDGVESAANDFNPFKSAPTAQAKAAEPSTVYKTVYQTMSKTFDGPIAGYSTVGQTDDTPETHAAAAPTSVVQAQASASQVKEQDTTAASIVKAQETAKGTDKSVLPESIMQSSSIDLDEHSTLAIATSTPTTLVQATKNVESSQISSATNAAAAASSSASPTAAAESSGSDTSGAAKAGIAIGVLGGVLVVALLIYFLFSRRRKQLERDQNQDNEKIHGPIVGRTASIRSTQTSATAPQLSLRPVTEFMPTFGERRSSKGAALALATGAAHATPRNVPQSPWERPGANRANDHPENPFGNNAERAHTPTGNDGPTNPFENPENVVGVAQTTNSPPKSSPIDTAAAAGAGALAGAAAGAALARKASTRKDAPAPLDLTNSNGPPSPADTEFSVHSVAPGQSPGPSRSAAAIAAAGGPAHSAVHRVQLDFKPTLEDEMGLRAGQLVRLLHEYDDGWSLCIRLDRSQQGVVPRTCLSTRPVKPRTAGSPPGGRNGPPVNPSGPRGPRGPGPNYPPGQRPMTPQSGRPQSPMHHPMQHGRPQSPAMMRPHSPATGRPMSPYGSRPASPATGRPMSPGPRAQSPGPRQQRRMSPPGPSPMNPNSGAPSQQQYRGPQGPPQGPIDRKPVPGQAY